MFMCTFITCSANGLRSVEFKCSMFSAIDQTIMLKEHSVEFNIYSHMPTYQWTSSTPTKVMYIPYKSALLDTCIRKVQNIHMSVRKMSQHSSALQHSPCDVTGPTSQKLILCEYSKYSNYWFEQNVTLHCIKKNYQSIVTCF